MGLRRGGATVPKNQALRLAPHLRPAVPRAGSCSEKARHLGGAHSEVCLVTLTRMPREEPARSGDLEKLRNLLGSTDYYSRIPPPALTTSGIAPRFRVRFSGSQASLVGRWLYQFDLEARRSTALLETAAEAWRGPISAQRGGFEFTTAREGSWEVFGQAYGATELWFTGHPVAFWTAQLILLGAWNLTIHRWLRRPNQRSLIRPERDLETLVDTSRYEQASSRRIDAPIDESNDHVLDTGMRPLADARKTRIVDVHAVVSSGVELVEIRLIFR
jgi:hypothetical protein